MYIIRIYSVSHSLEETPNLREASQRINKISELILLLSLKATWDVINIIYKLYMKSINIK